jgi:hypothetical protein
MHSDNLAALFGDLGIPVTAGPCLRYPQARPGKCRPIVAEALGYHHVTTAKLAAQSGGTWSRYGPGTTHGHHQAEHSSGFPALNMGPCRPG